MCLVWFGVCDQGRDLSKGVARERDHPIGYVYMYVYTYTTQDKPTHRLKCTQVTVPPAFSTASMAAAEARETSRWKGVRTCSPPFFGKGVEGLWGFGLGLGQVGPS